MCDKFTNTRFASLILNANDTQGVAIGQGKCRAVRLKANFYTLNTSTAQANGATPYFYYGDRNQQSWEYAVLSDNANPRLVNNRPGELIYCKDLNEVFVRFPVFDASVPSIEIQIIIYDSDED